MRCFDCAQHDGKTMSNEQLTINIGRMIECEIASLRSR
ncbi:hypothetical protein SAMN04488552_1720 [Christiangramia echinicola]|uniref:Uncharacterized protein n=1 Tax=Christiangramia echinicola TaxID=279359 RepID=A0A1H1NIX7_9FLAO|nr:hypothetical protein SAMN04488552_1720 [Christiangramia echinicola]